MRQAPQYYWVKQKGGDWEIAREWFDLHHRPLGRRFFLLTGTEEALSPEECEGVVQLKEEPPG